MKKTINISDAELPIMKELWERGPLTSPDIFAGMKGNNSTLKTLLQRLVAKGAVKAEEINLRHFRYSAVVTQDEYITASRKNFISRVFDGSTEKMLLNFVKEEKISREDLQRLMDMVGE